MDKKLISLIAATLFLGSLLVFHGALGQPDVITIDNPGLYTTDKYQGAQFYHKKHTGAVKDCKKCHHTWKEGDKVKKCTECHIKDSKVTAYNAFHDSCKGCHSAMKKEGKATGPTVCTKCHPKK